MLSADAVNPWVTNFRSSVDSNIASMSSQLVQKIEAAKMNALSTVKAELAQAIENSRQVLEASLNSVGQLGANKNSLLEIKDNLKVFSEKEL